LKAAAGNSKIGKKCYDESGSNETMTASEYFRGLVRERQRQKIQQKLDVLIADGLNSEPIVATPEFWVELEDRLFSISERAVH
jgi:hypothetical protein